MAAYPGAVGSGKVTIAFRGYNQSLHDAQDQGASSSGNLSDGAKIIDTFAHYTRLVHSSCNVLYQQIKAQSEFFIPNEAVTKQCIVSAQQVNEAVKKLFQLMEPHSHEQSFILLSEEFKLLVPAVVRFLKCANLLLFQLKCSPSPAQFQEATELFNNLRIYLRGVVEQIKSLQQNPPLLGSGTTINLQQFVSMCKETKAMQNKISAIAAKRDPEVSHNPKEAEKVFIELGGQFVQNIKTIIKFCGAADMSVEEETLLDQSNRLITSAKLLFRISSPQAAALYESDKQALVESLTTLVLEVQKAASPRSPSSPNQTSRAPSPNSRSILHSATFAAGNNKLAPPAGGITRQTSMGAGRGVGGVPEKKKEEEEYKPHLRAKLVNEIINTEKGYVSSLGIVKTVFMVQMKNTKWLKEEEYDTLFANLDDIVKINSRLYTHLMEKCKQTGDDLSEARVGELFVQEADRLVAYAKYVNNFDNSLKILEQLSNRKAAVSFFQGIMDNPQGGTQLLDLGSYLIMPVQRLPRYELLLRELRKFTPKSHKDSSAIDVALGKMKVVNAKINELKRDEENRVKWNQIKDSLTAEKMFSAATGELVPGINKSRLLFNEGSLEVALLKKLELKKGTQKEKLQRKTKMHVFLFDDMILFTEPKRGKYNIKYYVILDCDNVTVSQEKDTISLNQKDVVSSYTYEYVISCDGKEASEWFRGLTNALNTSVA